MEQWWEEYKVDLPDMENDGWLVDHFTISEQGDLETLRLAMQGRPVNPGRYTRLYRKIPEGTFTVANLVMSDTPAEIHDHLEPIRKARGRVLINGLGIGMVLRAVLAKPEVKHVDVVEISQSLVDLVASHYGLRPTLGGLNADERARSTLPDYMGERKREDGSLATVSVYCADAYTIQWPKQARWDVAWHDIWDKLTADNLPLMGKLHRKYGRRVRWQGSWGKEWARREQRAWRDDPFRLMMEGMRERARERERLAEDFDGVKL